MAQEVLEIRVEGMDELDRVSIKLSELNSQFETVRGSSAQSASALGQMGSAMSGVSGEMEAFSGAAEEGGGSSLFLAAQLAVAYRQMGTMQKIAAGATRALAPLTAAFVAAAPAAVVATGGLAAFAAAAFGVTIAMGVAQSRLNDMRNSFQDLQGYLPQTTAALSENQIAVMESSRALAELHRNSVLYNAVVTTTSNLSSGLTLGFNKLTSAVLDTTDRIIRIGMEIKNLAAEFVRPITDLTTRVETAIRSVNIFGVDALDMINNMLNPLAGLQNAFSLVGQAVTLTGEAVEFWLGVAEEGLGITKEQREEVARNIPVWERFTTAIEQNRIITENHSATVRQQTVDFVNQHSAAVLMVQEHNRLLTAQRFFIDAAKRLGFLTEENTAATAANNTGLSEAERLAIKAKEAQESLAASIRSVTAAVQAKNKVNTIPVVYDPKTDPKTFKGFVDAPKEALKEGFRYGYDENGDRVNITMSWQVDTASGNALKTRVNEIKEMFASVSMAATGFDLSGFFGRSEEAMSRFKDRMDSLGKGARGTLKTMSTAIQGFGSATQAGLAAAFGTTEKFSKAFAASMGSALISSGVKLGWEGVAALVSGNPMGAGMLAVGTGMVGAGRAMGGATKAPEAKKEKDSTPMGSNMQIQVLNQFGFVGDRRAAAREVADTVDEARRRGNGRR